MRTSNACGQCIWRGQAWRRDDVRTVFSRLGIRALPEDRRTPQEPTTRVGRRRARRKVTSAWPARPWPRRRSHRSPPRDAERRKGMKSHEHSWNSTQNLIAFHDFPISQPWLGTLPNHVPELFASIEATHGPGATVAGVVFVLDSGGLGHRVLSK